MISKESSIIKISITTRSPRYLRRREILKRDGCFLFKLLLTLYCIVGGDCEPRRGIKELQAALAEDRVPPPFLGHCDFEAPCGSWNYTGNFKIVSKNDATEYTAGHYLRLDGPDIGQIWSILIPHTGSQCFLKFATRQIKMKNEGIIRLIIMSNNITTSVASERPGNDDAKLVVSLLYTYL